MEKNYTESKRKAEESPEANKDKDDKMPRTGHSPPPQRTRRNSVSEPISETMLKNMFDGLESRLSARIDGMGSELKKNTADIKEIRKNLSDTETNLLERMDRQKRELEDKIKGSTCSTSSGPGRLSQKSEDSYWHFRKSLSVWPVAGDDASAGVRTFLIQRLRFSEEQVKDLGRILVKRMREPVAKARKEVYCTFETKETRDLVKAAGKNLAGDKEAGMRAQFPGFLIDTFRTFESIGYHLRNSDPSVRRSVKFDDNAMDLVMDIKVGNGDEWQRIRSSEAKKTMEDNPHIKRGPSEMSSSALSALLSKKTPATGANSTPMNH